MLKSILFPMFKLALGTVLGGTIVFSFLVYGDEWDKIWEKTTVDRALLDRYIKEIYPCAASEANFLGCVHLVNALGENLTPVEQFIPDDVRTGFPDIRFTTLRAAGRLLMAQVNEWGEHPPATVRETVEREMSGEKALREASAAVYALPDHGGVDFDALVTGLLKRAPAEMAPQRVIAKAINRLILVHDGHGRIDSLDHVQDLSRLGGAVSFGIGVMVKPVGDNMIVLSVIADSAADQAGIQVGDVFVKIDDHDMRGASLDMVTSWIRGPRDSSLKIQVRRAKTLIEKPFEVTRRPSPPVNVDRKIVADLGRKVGYIRVRSTKDPHLTNAVGEAIEYLEKNGAVALILDLRDEEGGHTTQAQGVAGLFIGQQLVFTARAVVGGQVVESVPPLSLFGLVRRLTKRPLAVLINGGTASASEIIAGSLQDHRRAWLVGERTYGKGTEQDGTSTVTGYPTVMEFATVRGFFLPSGRTNQISGVQPDFDAYIRPKPSLDEVFSRREENEVPSALPPVGKPWVNPRSEEIKKVHLCLDAKRRSELIYAARAEAEKPADFPVLKAEEVLDCSADDPSYFNVEDGVKSDEPNNDEAAMESEAKEIEEANAHLPQPGAELVEWLKSAGGVQIPADYVVPKVALAGAGSLTDCGVAGDRDDGPSVCDVQSDGKGTILVSLAHRRVLEAGDSSFLSRLLLYVIRDVQLLQERGNPEARTCRFWIQEQNSKARVLQFNYRASRGLQGKRKDVSGVLPPPKDCR